MPSDRRWNQILQKKDTYLGFALNTVQDSLASPSRLTNWRQNSAGDVLCPLGCKVTGSLLHILCQCQKAIKEELQSLITWQHYSILLAMHKRVKYRIKEAMESRGEARMEDSIRFRSDLGRSLHLVPSPLKHLYWRVPTTAKCSLMFMISFGQGATVPLCDCCYLWTGLSSQ